MAQPSVYAVVRVHAGSYRLDRTQPPRVGPAAFVIQVRDRLGNPLGWKLKPLVMMQGARSRVWPTAADAIAATKLFTPGAARAAVQQADGTIAILLHAGPARTPDGGAS